MKNLALISQKTEKFWTGRSYCYDHKTIYRYKDTHEIIYLERKSVTNHLVFNEIYLSLEINNSDFEINTRFSLSSYFKRGLRKYYDFWGATEIILVDSEVENLLKKLTSIGLSIQLKENQLTFIFNSETYFKEEVEKQIFQLIELIIKKLKSFE